MGFPRVTVAFSNVNDGNLRLGDREGAFRAEGRKNRAAFMEKLGLDGQQLVTSIPDGKNLGIVIVDAPPANDDLRPAAECLITQTPDLAVGVVHRDCMPVMIVDENRTTVAAVHLSRENLRRNFLQKVVSQLKTMTNGQLLAYMGPRLSHWSHEVGFDCVKAFSTASGRHMNFFQASKPGYYLFKFEDAVYAKLDDLGVHVEYDCEIDTFTNPNYGSLRKSGNDPYGISNVSLIALRSEMA